MSRKWVWDAPRRQRERLRRLLPQEAVRALLPQEPPCIKTPPPAQADARRRAQSGGRTHGQERGGRGRQGHAHVQRRQWSERRQREWMGQAI